MKRSVFFLLLSGVCSLPAQTGATLAAAGYSAPAAPIPVAPGQVITLFFRDVGPLPSGKLRSGEAGSVPLPTTIGGLSARIVQSQTSLPIFAVRQENDCAEGQVNPACLLTSVRVQIPNEILGTAQLVLDVDGQPSRSFLLTEVSDNTHILTSCDATWDTSWSSTCNRAAFHQDGSAISQQVPARPGETITVYLWGMGITSPLVPAGQASPTGAILRQAPGTSALHARFVDSHLVSLVARPAFYSPEDVASAGSPIEFVGLTPGQVGLYQLNVRIPASLTTSNVCEGPIVANTILRITTLYAGTAEVGICLKP